MVADLYYGAGCFGTSRLSTSINPAILTTPTAIPLVLLPSLLLAWMLVSDRRSIADENQQTAEFETTQKIGIATLCKFLLGAGKLHAIEALVKPETV